VTAARGPIELSMSPLGRDRSLDRAAGITAGFSGSIAQSTLPFRLAESRASLLLRRKHPRAMVSTPRLAQHALIVAKATNTPATSTAAQVLA
jgi:hypothetical protein